MENMNNFCHNIRINSLFYYLINGRFSINIYKMAIKCIIIILLLFKYYNNGEYE